KGAPSVATVPRCSQLVNKMLDVTIGVLLVNLSPPWPGQTRKNEPAEVRAPARGGAKRIRLSAPSASYAQGIARCTRYTATVGAAPHMPLLTPWGNASSLSGGRILKCFPHPIASVFAQNRHG